MVVWRLEDQEIKLSPKKTQNLDVEHRVSRQLTQSASE
jgi:hypothetical protein